MTFQDYNSSGVTDTDGDWFSWLDQKAIDTLTRELATATDPKERAEIQAMLTRLQRESDERKDVPDDE